MFHQDSSEKLTVRDSKEDPIKYVIVLMMENHSFDQMLGSIKQEKPDIEGISDDDKRFNLDFSGNKIYQVITKEKQIPLDPFHEVPNVLKQISQDNGGYVQDFITNYPNSSAADRQNVMSYYPRAFLPALHALASEYTVCDHWFSSVPGPTWTNRFFLLSGTSSGRTKMPGDLKEPEAFLEFFYQRQDTIFDRLNEKKISWRVYHGDVPISLVLTNNRKPKNLIHFHHMNDFYDDVKGDAKEFPQFTFIEPRYLGHHQNDDHPPHNSMKAQQLIADVYNGIRANETLWNQALFVVTYDEHGGFYDHVTPPPAVPPDDSKGDGYDFTQLGVRVPTLLISPWARKPVEKTVFDHTSLLRYLTDKWELGPLGNRTAKANNLSVALDFTSGPRTGCLPVIKLSEDDAICPKPYLEKHHENGNQQSLHFFANYLNETNKISVAPLPNSSRLCTFKDKVGEKLEEYGFLRLGMWFRKDMDDYRKKRVERTLAVLENTLKM